MGRSVWTAVTSEDWAQSGSPDGAGLGSGKGLGDKVLGLGLGDGGGLVGDGVGLVGDGEGRGAGLGERDGTSDGDGLPEGSAEGPGAGVRVGLGLAGKPATTREGLPLQPASTAASTTATRSLLTMFRPFLDGPSHAGR